MSTPQTFRIFVSSPGDAHFERQRMDRVVARLNGELAGVARLSTVRWETEFYQAHSTFQAQIPAAVDCNVVIAVFRARLGTELPTDFARMPDGQAYPSGTAYEVLTAIAQRQKGGELPDVFVFRCSEPPLIRIDDRETEKGVRADWERLKSFFGQWFLTDDGHFRAAFQTFASTDDFEQQVERLLRNWLRERLAKGKLVAWPVATRGSPYPGLQSFGPRHSAVFFGRARDTARAVEAWSDAGRRGSPFLLVVGASGAGKSSLARAGLVPRLTTPGVVPAIDLWRSASLRPSDAGGDPILALAHALLDDRGARSGSGEDDPPALPELAAGDYGTPADLSGLLAHADATAVRPILGALDKAGEAERRAQASDRPLRCDLVLVVDQLDDLFTGEIEAPARKTFVDLLEALLQTRRVWVVATLRADLYELFLKDETLFRLKTVGATYDLASPILADLAEAVRGPARAADLDWEVDSETGERLDDRLVGDIDRTDLLPIVQFVLDRLFQRRVSREGRLVLTHEAYQALGRLDGAIDTAAEAALAPLGPSGASALPRLLRALVVLASPPGSLRPIPTLRQVPRAAAAFDAASARLVTALTDARVLISTRDSAGVPVVTLAHQRAVEAWRRARDIIAESGDLLRVREDIETARQRWDGAGGRNDLLIAPGLPLTEAERAAAVLGDELSPESLAFVARSGNAARLRQRLVAIAAVVFFAIAVGAGALGILANWEKGRAETATLEAQDQSRRAEAARVLADQQRRVAEVARKQAEKQRQEAANRRRDAELRLAAADELMVGVSGKSEELRACMAATQRVSAQPAPPASRSLFVGRWHVDQGFGSTDTVWNADGTCEGKNIFNNSVRALDLKHDVCTWEYQPIGPEEFGVNYHSSALGAEFPKYLHFKVLSPNRLHNVDYGNDVVRVVCPAEELAMERDKVAAVRASANADPGNLQRQHELADSLQHLGNVIFLEGDAQGSLDALSTALVIRNNLSVAEPANVAWQQERATNYIWIAQARLSLKQATDGLDDVDAAQAILDRLRRSDPNNVFLERQLGFSDELAGMLRKAGTLDRSAMLGDLRKAVDLARRAAEALPGDSGAWQDKVRYLVDLSTVADPAEARAALGEAIADLERLEKQRRVPPGSEDWLVDLRRLLAAVPPDPEASHNR